MEFVWIQGILTSIVAGDSYYQLNLDDGTNSLMVIVPPENVAVVDLRIGDYVLVQGSITKGEDEVSGMPMVAIEARIISPVADPNMETLWNLEVIEGMKRSMG